MSMSKRYDSIEELLLVARRDNMIVRSNSLAGVFMWTPDKFEFERSANMFPARCDACNFWLEPVADTISGLEREVASKRREINEIENEISLLQQNVKPR